MNRRVTFGRVGAVLGASLLIGSLGLATAAPVAAYTVWFASLTGAEEVPGPGDPDADGLARITVDPAGGQVCVEWDILDLAPATAAHIHAGAAGVAGGVVVALPTPDADGAGGDCVDGLDEATLQGVVDDPSSFYVNVHNAEFAAGGIRGQLDAVEMTTVNAAKLVCPPEIQSPADLLAAPGGACTPAADTGSIDPPPPGKVYDPEPLIFDMKVTLEDDGGTLTLDDAELDGGGTCGPTTCSISRSYRWVDVFVGPTTVTEESFPDGYHFGWAVLRAATDGGNAPSATVDVETATIGFDTTGLGDEPLSVVLYDFADVTTPTPAPTPTPTPRPGAGSVAPTTFSPPPTDAVSVGSSGSAAVLPFLLVIASVGGLAIATAGRRRRDRT